MAAICLSFVAFAQNAQNGLLDKAAFDTIIAGKPVSLYTNHLSSDIISAFTC